MLQEFATLGERLENENKELAARLSWILELLPIVVGE